MSHRLRQLLSAALFCIAGLIAGREVAWADSSQDATITVTPVVQVSLTLDANAYSFGPIDVHTSTNSATAVRLNNAGDVSVAVDKRIAEESNPPGWTASVSSGTDTYVLYVATASTRPNLDDFTASTILGAQGEVTPLTGTSGLPTVMPPLGGGAGSSVDLWFRLDMPTQITHSAGRSFTVRFTGTAQ